MLQRKGPYFAHLPADQAPTASRQLEASGYAVLEDLLAPAAVQALAVELTALYQERPRDNRAGAARPAAEDEDFRYEAFNYSPLAQAAIGNETLLDVLTPLLGPDCHVIANTCWRNPAGASHGHGGGFWHIDSGPHVPRPPEVPWDDRIPYPVFAVGVHLLLKDCDLASGPTGVLPGSHRSGQAPPPDRLSDPALTFDGKEVVPLLGRAGDALLFVSDVWHRRMPCLEGDAGRFFLQAHYGRRDIAQRLRTTAQVNHVAPAARDRAVTQRQRQLIGLHEPLFYDG
ncbi:MAG: phytanoyl-CoA dioxygenase family protein [Pseudomonadota bacterium]